MKLTKKMLNFNHFEFKRILMTLTTSNILFVLQLKVFTILKQLLLEPTCSINPLAIAH